MASKVKGAARVEAALRLIIPEIKKPENMRAIGQQAAAMIKKRTRLGSSVPSDGAPKETPMKKLSPSTVQDRKRAKARGELSGFASPGKSNLTRTGQLLDSEGVTKVGYGTVHVGPTGGRTDSAKSNSEIAEYVSKAGRPFNHLSKTEIKRLQDSVKKVLRDFIKKALTNR